MPEKIEQVMDAESATKADPNIFDAMEKLLVDKMVEIESDVYLSGTETTSGKCTQIIRRLKGGDCDVLLDGKTRYAITPQKIEGGSVVGYYIHSGQKRIIRLLSESSEVKE